MSDSILSEAMSPAPSALDLEKQLRNEVEKRFRKGTQGEMTLNQIRQAAEKKLALDSGFYAGHSKWKAESKRIVLDEMDRQNAEVPGPQTVATDPSPARMPPRSKAAKPSRVSRPPKRTSPDDGGRVKKRSKKSEADSESDDQLSSPPNELDEYAPKKSPKPKPRPNPAIRQGATKVKSINGTPANVGDDSESPLSDSQDVDSEAMPGKSKKAEPKESESEMSVVLDEGPKAKSRKRKSSEAAEGETKKSKASKPKTEAEVDPDEAEIKRLQGWLVRCGIRKMWWKELKPYEGSKAKIRHLKAMLADAGMTGRYSIEKATQIKEARELAADIEAVKEGAERWGKEKDGSEKEGEDKSKRRLFRGAKNYDFLSSDGEETD